MHCLASKFLSLCFRTTLCILTILALPSFASDLGGNPEPGQPLALQFSSPDGIDSNSPHLWDFGDGNTSTALDPQHTYDYPGRYRVTLTVDGEAPLVDVVDAGVVITSQGFEDTTWPDEVNWPSVRLTPSAAGAIVGGKGVWHNITDPETTCTSPGNIPPHRGGDDEDPRTDPYRTWVMTALVDQQSAPVGVGNWFEVMSIRDDDLSESIFGATMLYKGSGYEIQAYARDNALVGPGGASLPVFATTWRPVSVDVLRIELHGWIDNPALPSGGGVRLRVLDHATGQELVNEIVTQLDNDLLSIDQFQFGVLDAQAVSDGSIRLDEAEILSATCVPTSPDDLIGHWDFDDATDLGIDSSPIGLDGSTAGGATSVVGRSRTPLISELAMALDGTGSLKILNQGEDLSGATELTVSAWVKVASHTQMNVFRSQQPLGLHSDRIVVSNYTQGTGWETLQANPAPPLDTWYHLAGVFDDGELRIYVDGVLAGSRTLSFTALQGASFAEWGIGARVPGAVGPDQFFTGEVDDVKLYRRVLSAVEIRGEAGVCAD